MLTEHVLGVQGIKERAKLQQIVYTPLSHFPALPCIKTPFEIVLFKNYSHFSSLFPHVWCDSSVPKGWRAWIHLCPVIVRGTHLSADVLIFQYWKEGRTCLIQARARQWRERSEEWGRFPAVSGIWVGFNRWRFCRLDLGENHEARSLEWSAREGVRRS